MTTADLSALMREMEFTPDDLAANSSGQLSEMQAYRLRVRRQRSMLIGLGLVLMASIIAALLIYGGSQNSNPILTLIGIIVTVLSAALTGVIARHWMRLSADIQANRVVAVEGAAERVIKPISQTVVNYMIRVGETEFYVSKEAFDVFEHGERYTLYRTPYASILLSAGPSGAHDEFNQK